LLLFACRQPEPGPCRIARVGSFDLTVAHVEQVRARNLPPLDRERATRLLIEVATLWAATAPEAKALDVDAALATRVEVRRSLDRSSGVDPHGRLQELQEAVRRAEATVSVERFTCPK
jgi:hypothetical protein